MSEKMEAFVNEPRPLSIDGEWSPCVDNRADKAKEARKKQEVQAENERTMRLAEEARNRQAAWEEEQRAKARAKKRAHWILFLTMFGLALILVGGIAMNYIEGFAFPVAVALAIIGVAAYMFALGWIYGGISR